MLVEYAEFELCLGTRLECLSGGSIRDLLVENSLRMEKVFSCSIVLSSSLINCPLWKGMYICNQPSPLEMIVKSRSCPYFLTNSTSHIFSIF